ncbi:MAG: histidine--tRNA ligase [Oscillospiraceae bacterium]|jgi:histidyl-tRNA synthetase|nr:histidine--tRNA ligase [Oscillospiraceae bacterium]
MALITKAPRGTEDKLPADIYKWHTVEKITRAIAESYGCKEIRTPAFEHTELFQRGIGGTTDVVQKEMYTFDDKKGRSLTLKPEGTAGAARAAIEHGLIAAALPLKLFYFTSCFRYEAPQSGRLREHRQFGVEVYGAVKPLADAEVICLANDVFIQLGLKNVQLEINSIGCSGCRGEYKKELIDFYKQQNLCNLCSERLERNPMRLLDCKSDSCREVNKNAPVITKYLCNGCEAHFTAVKSALTALGVSFTESPRLVRGLDYYTNTVFEFKSESLGAQDTVCAGGRYDGLIAELGGTPVAGLGFGMGLERLILVMQAQGLEFEPAKSCDLYIAALDSGAEITAAKLVKELRECGFWAETDLAGRGLGAQMKYADKLGARFSMVLGSNELSNGTAIIKNMQNGEKREVGLSAEKVKLCLIEF